MVKESESVREVKVSDRVEEGVCKRVSEEGSE